MERRITLWSRAMASPATSAPRYTYIRKVGQARLSNIFQEQSCRWRTRSYRAGLREEHVPRDRYTHHFDLLALLSFGVPLKHGVDCFLQLSAAALVDTTFDGTISVSMLCHSEIVILDTDMYLPTHIEDSLLALVYTHIGSSESLVCVWRWRGRPCPGKSPHRFPRCAIISRREELSLH